MTTTISVLLRSGKILEETKRLYDQVHQERGGGIRTTKFLCAYVLVIECFCVGS